MDFNKLKQQAQDLVREAWRHRSPQGGRRGAQEHRTGQGSVSDKGKAAVDAIKDPGKPGV